MNTFYSIFACSVALTTFTGCATDLQLPLSASTSNHAGVSKWHSPSAANRHDTSGPTLYALNSGGGQAFSVSIYLRRGALLLRSLSLGKYGQGITVDSVGHLYVGVPLSQGDPSGKAVLNIYSSRGAKMVQTLQQSHPFALMTLDSEGDLYSLCAADRVCEYAAGGSQVLKPVPIRKIALRNLGIVAHALAVDPSGNLAVSSVNSVSVFAPGAAKPYWTISNVAAGAVAFDASGDLYVAVNAGGSSPSVEVYSPGGTSPIQTISDGVTDPVSLSFDSSGKLYVLNAGILSQGSCTQPPSVELYAPSNSTPIRTVSTGLVCGNALAFSVDTSAYVYVSNGGFPDAGNVVVYAKSSNIPKRTVTQAVQNPTMLGIGP